MNQEKHLPTVSNTSYPFWVRTSKGFKSYKSLQLKTPFGLGYWGCIDEKSINTPLMELIWGKKINQFNIDDVGILSLNPYWNRLRNLNYSFKVRLQECLTALNCLDKFDEIISQISPGDIYKLDRSNYKWTYSFWDKYKTILSPWINGVIISHEIEGNILFYWKDSIKKVKLPVQELSDDSTESTDSNLFNLHVPLFISADVRAFVNSLQEVSEIKIDSEESYTIWVKTLELVATKKISYNRVLPFISKIKISLLNKEFKTYYREYGVIPLLKTEDFMNLVRQSTITKLINEILENPIWGIKTWKLSQAQLQEALLSKVAFCFLTYGKLEYHNFDKVAIKEILEKSPHAVLFLEKSGHNVKNWEDSDKISILEKSPVAFNLIPFLNIKKDFIKYGITNPICNTVLQTALNKI
jgi:hypothetical protein